MSFKVFRGCAVSFMRALKLQCVVYLALAFGLCSSGLMPVAKAAITNDVTIQPQVRHQTFEGFGAGTMDQFVPYWYTVWPSGALEDYLDKMYTLDNNGLGLTISRVPMPVGDAPGHYHMWAYGHQGWRPPECFEPEDGTFQWSGHDDILWHIQGAADRDVRMWAYWHSVPYWLTVSGCTAGHADGTQNNLQAGQEDRFAEHICDVIEHFRDYWDVDFEFVGAINEPDEDWWDSWDEGSGTLSGGQPGCHVSSSQAVTIYQELKNEMTLRGLTNKFVAPDSFSINVDHNLTYLDTMLGSSVGDDISVLSGHQYYVTASGMYQWYLRSVDYDRSFWMSEWGDWWNDGWPDDNPYPEQAMNYANMIHQGLNELHATAWVLWEPDFLLDTTTSGFTFRKSYWIVAQFSRFIRPGMQLVDSIDSTSDCKTTVWIDPTGDPTGTELVLVTVNNHNTQTADITYDLSPFHGVQVNEVRRTSETEDYANIAFTQASAYEFSISAPSDSVVTVWATIQQCPDTPAELTGDCIFDVEDLKIVAQNWLDSQPSPCSPVPGDTNEDCNVDLKDQAEIFDIWLNVKAFDPDPADAQTDVVTNRRISWGDNFYAVSYDVYLGTDMTAVQNATDASPEYKGNQTETFYPVSLNTSQLYYWRIDPVDGLSNVHKGDVWSFTTGTDVLDPDIVGWWKLDESAGPTAYDSVPSGNNGSLTGNPVWRPSEGVDGGAIDLDGNGDYVNIPGFNLTTNAVTFTAWINGWKAADWAGIVYSRSEQATGMHFGGNNTLHYTWNYDDYGTWGWTGGPVIPQNEWAFVAVAIEPDKATAYVYTDSGGLIQAVNSVAHIPQTIDSLEIGRDSVVSTRCFNGLIDDVRIYNRTLLEQEILNLLW